MVSLWRLLFAGLLLALLQQYGLRQRPGRLLAVRPAMDGAAALELRYSRPVDGASLAPSIRLAPEAPFSATADGATVHLRLTQPYRAGSPLVVRLGGRDQQGQPLRRVQLRWEPRPLLLALVSGPRGQRLELGRPDGPWQPVTPWESSISNVLPLRDGRGVVYAAAVGFPQPEELVCGGVAVRCGGATTPTPGRGAGRATLAPAGSGPPSIATSAAATPACCCSRGWTGPP